MIPIGNGGEEGIPKNPGASCPICKQPELGPRRKLLKELNMTTPCGFVPPTPGYAPCTRERGHGGPCAHELATPAGGSMKNVLAVRVRNHEGRCLMMLSRKLQAWTLPGGKMEQGETWERAA